MRFVSYNIQYGLGKDGHFDLARIARAVDGADAIALQEVERFWTRSGMVDQPEELARPLPDYHWVYGPGLDMDATVEGPDGRKLHRRRQFGNMLLARRPIRAARTHLLPKFGTVRQYSLQRCALEGVIDAGPEGLRVYSIHLTHLADGTRGPQVDAILAIHRRAPAEGGPWCGAHEDPGWKEGGEVRMPRHAVLMGDFNFPPGSPLYPRIVGPWSSEYGRLNGIDGFVDAWVAAGHGEDEGATCLDRFGRPHRIDFCFVSSALAGRIGRAWIDAEADGSDHQPIWTEIDL